MPKKDLTTDEKAELALAQISYINEQMSQIFSSWANDMEALIHATVDAGVLAKASKDKIKAEVTADQVTYKDKSKNK